MIVAIDCNILVMCLTSRSPYHLIYKSLIAEQFELCVSSSILLEYEEIIQQKYGLATAATFLSLLRELPNVNYISTAYKWQLIESDPDDNKYVDCAIAGKANAIVTEDNHFTILKSIPFPKVETLSIDDFMRHLAKSDKSFI